MKALIVSLLFAAQLSPSLALANEGSGGGSEASSATSLAGIAASQMASVVAIEGSASLGVDLSEGASEIIQASVTVGESIVVKSIEISGQLVKLTYEASIKGSQLALKLGKDAIEFSATISRAVLEASLNAAGQTLNGLVKVASRGTVIALRVTAIVAGSAGLIAGHVLTLAATPAIVVGVVLNDIGRSLYTN